jgi:hypothetical protein
VRKIRLIKQERTWMVESFGFPPLPQKQKRGKDGAPNLVEARRAPEKRVPVESRGFPPLRQKKGARMGHGTYVRQ